MGHPLRLYEPDRVYEITSYMMQGRFLLRPSPELNELIAGVIGRAQCLYPDLRIYNVEYVSNHCNWLVSSPDPAQIPAFMGFVNGNVSDEVGRLHDWPGKKWQRPHRPIPVLDEAKLIDRMKYQLAHGCKEDLVESPRDWPGVTAVHSLLGEKALTGTWFDRDAETKARRAGKTPGKYDFATTYTVRFSKLPCWAHLTDAEYIERIAELVTEIEEENRARREQTGKKVLGVEAVCAMDPHHRPKKVPKSPAPLCHASSRRLREAFREIYRAFVDAYRAAAARLKAGEENVTFPPYCFPPRRPFVYSSA